MSLNIIAHDNAVVNLYLRENSAMLEVSQDKCETYKSSDYSVLFNADLSEVIKNELSDPGLDKFEAVKFTSCRVQDFLVKYYKSVGQHEKAKNIKSCSEYLTFKQFHDKNSTKRLEKANFCRHPLDIMCAWRRMIRRYPVLRQAVTALAETHKIYFLTLTVKNWPDISKAQLGELRRKAVDFVRRYYKLNDFYLQYEVTYNRDTHTYHPHIHFLLASDVMLDFTRDAIHRLQEAWGALWGVEWYKAILKPVKNASAGAIELCKYFYFSDCINYEQMSAMAAAVHGMRQNESSGKFLTAMRAGRETVEAMAKERDELMSAIEFHRLFYRFERSVGYIEVDMSVDKKKGE